MCNKEIAAYAAGLFDGEGYVGIDKTSVSSAIVRRINHGIRVIISQKDGLIMYWLKENFGGNVSEQRNGTKYSIYRWRVHAEKAERFLKCIRPYVKIKQKQVEFAISFNEERKRRVLASGRSRSNGRYITMTDEEIQWRLKNKEELIALKKVYTPYIKDIQEKIDK